MINCVLFLTEISLNTFFIWVIYLKTLFSVISSKLLLSNLPLLRQFFFLDFLDPTKHRPGWKSIDFARIPFSPVFL